MIECYECDLQGYIFMSEISEWSPNQLGGEDEDATVLNCWIPFENGSVELRVLLCPSCDGYGVEQ